MRNAPPGGAPYHRVGYGEGDVEFMLQPWFDVVEATRPVDIVITGAPGAKGADLGQALRSAGDARVLARDGGAVVVAARLEDGKGDAEPLDDGRLVVVAASEAPEIVRLAGLRPAVDVEEALDIAYEHIGRPARASVAIVRPGPSGT